MKTGTTGKTEVADANKKLAKETKMMNRRNEERTGKEDDTIDIIAMTCPFY